MTFDDLPIIQCKPGPTDAELEADRNIKHAQALAEFEREERDYAAMEELGVFRGFFDHIPPRAVRG
ncbi:MAG TPA: hypothetical protein PLH92_18780 [Mycobacterium sp.]|nr:hypothetical protein [Mycobacterium sp.]